MMSTLREPGLYQKIDRKEYDSDPGVNQSALNRLRITPAHCRAYQDGKGPEPTAAMKLGTIIHHALLDPEDFMSNHKLAPNSDKRTKEYKDWAKELKPTDVPVSPDERTQIFGMIDSLRCHKFGSKFFHDISTEVTIFSDHPQTGLRKKGRLDIIRRTGNTIGDLKTCQDASSEAMSKYIWNYGTYLQAAFYIDLCHDVGLTDVEVFIIVAVEKEPPYAVMFHQIDSDAIERGRAEYQTLMHRYKDCKEKSEWPGYPEQPQLLSLPHWIPKL